MALHPDGATRNIRHYGHVARADRPDHPAILPAHRGACSVADCRGVNTCDCVGAGYADFAHDLAALVNDGDAANIPPPTVTC